MEKQKFYPGFIFLVCLFCANIFVSAQNDVMMQGFNTATYAPMLLFGDRQTELGIYSTTESVVLHSINSDWQATNLLRQITTATAKQI